MLEDLHANAGTPRVRRITESEGEEGRLRSVSVSWEASDMEVGCPSRGIDDMFE